MRTNLVGFLLLLFCDTVQSAFLAILSELLFHQIYFPLGRCLDWLAEAILEQYCRTFYGFLCLIVVCNGKGAWDIMNVSSVHWARTKFIISVRTHKFEEIEGPIHFVLNYRYVNFKIYLKWHLILKLVWIWLRNSLSKVVYKQLLLLWLVVSLYQRATCGFSLYQIKCVFSSWFSIGYSIVPGRMQILWHMVSRAKSVLCNVNRCQVSPKQFHNW